MGCQTSTPSTVAGPQSEECVTKTLFQAPNGTKLEQHVLKVVQLTDASEYLEAASTACDGPRSDIRTRILTGVFFVEERRELEFKEVPEELASASSATERLRQDVRPRIFEQHGNTAGAFCEDGTSVYEDLPVLSERQCTLECALDRVTSAPSMRETLDFLIDLHHRDEPCVGVVEAPLCRIPLAATVLRSPKSELSRGPKSPRCCSPQRMAVADEPLD